MLKLLAAITLAAASGTALADTATVPAPAPAPTPIPAANQGKNAVVCRSSVETGSLIARHKTCLTRKQWVKADDQSQDDARRFVEDNRWKPQ